MLNPSIHKYLPRRERINRSGSFEDIPDIPDNVYLLGFDKQKVDLEPIKRYVRRLWLPFESGKSAIPRRWLHPKVEEFAKEIACWVSDYANDPLKLSAELTRDYCEMLEGGGVKEHGFLALTAYAILEKRCWGEEIWGSKNSENKPFLDNAKRESGDIAPPKWPEDKERITLIVRQWMAAQLQAKLLQPRDKSNVPKVEYSPGDPEERLKAIKAVTSELQLEGSEDEPDRLHSDAEPDRLRADAEPDGLHGAQARSASQVVQIKQEDPDRPFLTLSALLKLPGAKPPAPNPKAVENGDGDNVLQHHADAVDIAQSSTPRSESRSALKRKRPKGNIGRKRSKISKSSNSQSHSTPIFQGRVLTSVPDDRELGPEPDIGFDMAEEQSEDTSKDVSLASTDDDNQRHRHPPGLIAANLPSTSSAQSNALDLLKIKQRAASGEPSPVHSLSLMDQDDSNVEGEEIGINEASAPQLSDGPCILAATRKITPITLSTQASPKPSASSAEPGPVEGENTHPAPNVANNTDLKKNSTDSSGVASVGPLRTPISKPVTKVSLAESSPTERRQTRRRHVAADVIVQVSDDGSEREIDATQVFLEELLSEQNSPSRPGVSTPRSGILKHTKAVQRRSNAAPDSSLTASRSTPRRAVEGSTVSKTKAPTTESNAVCSIPVAPVFAPVPSTFDPPSLAQLDDHLDIASPEIQSLASQDEVFSWSSLKFPPGTSNVPRQCPQCDHSLDRTIDIMIDKDGFAQWKRTCIYCRYREGTRPSPCTCYNCQPLANRQEHVLSTHEMPSTGRVAPLEPAGRYFLDMVLNSPVSAPPQNISTEASKQPSSYCYSQGVSDTHGNGVQPTSQTQVLIGRSNRERSEASSYCFPTPTTNARQQINADDRDKTPQTFDLPDFDPSDLGYVSDVEAYQSNSLSIGDQSESVRSTVPYFRGWPGHAPYEEPSEKIYLGREQNPTPVSYTTSSNPQSLGSQSSAVQIGDASWSSSVTPSDLTSIGDADWIVDPNEPEIEQYIADIQKQWGNGWRSKLQAGGVFVQSHPDSQLALSLVWLSSLERHIPTLLSTLHAFREEQEANARFSNRQSGPTNRSLFASFDRRPKTMSHKEIDAWHQFLRSSLVYRNRLAQQTVSYTPSHR